MEEVILDKFRWTGMLSMWGQGDVGHQGVCYAGLNNYPTQFIPKIGVGEPPVTKWFTRFVPVELANDWMAHLINNVFPDEILKHMTFTRVRSKAHWPRSWGRKMEGGEILDDYNFDGDVEEYEAQRRRKYAGTVPWLRVEYSQELPIHVMFATAILLRFVTEHGRVVKMHSLLPQLAPEIDPHHHTSLAINLAGSGGHSLSSWNFGYYAAFPAVSAKFSWKEHFLKLFREKKPFYEAPRKVGDVDSYFAPQWPNRTAKLQETECFASDYDTYQLERNGLLLHHHHRWITELLNAFNPKGK